MSELKPQIAVVDDDCAVREALTRLLETSSYEVQTFAGASQFIATLGHRKPDCIVVDLQMPVMTGLELQHYLTRASILIPVIIVTAHDEPGSRERAPCRGGLRPRYCGPCRRGRLPGRGVVSDKDVRQSSRRCVAREPCRPHRPHTIPGSGESLPAR